MFTGPFNQLYNQSLPDLIHYLDNKTKNRIIAAVRKISRWNPARQAVKNAAKVDKALFKCSKCQNLSYEGKSSVLFEHYKELHPDKVVIMEYCDVDHVEPVVPVTGWDSWDSFMERLFCEEDNLQALCKSCHKVKTMAEAKKRRAHKYGKKQ